MLVQILDDLVSRKHLQLIYKKEENAFYARDMDSRHGTFHHGEKLEKEVKLQNEDVLSLGKTHIFFSKEDFPNQENALNYYKKAGERFRQTLTD